MMKIDKTMIIMKSDFHLEALESVMCDVINTSKNEGCN